MTSFVNPRYLDLEFLRPLGDAFQNRRSFSSKNTDDPIVVADIHPVAIFPNFLEESYAIKLQDFVTN